MSSTSHFVSVIVPVFNGGRFLNSCLDALLASDHSEFEIIVVDDGSTDDSAMISRAKGAVVISSGRRQSGPAAARNLAANEAKGDILLFVDADVVVKTDTISKVANAFAEKPEISALFGSYDDDPGEKNFLSQYKNLQHHFVHQNSKPEASTFWSGLGAIRRDVFLAHGGFDCEKFSVPSIEDIDLGFRLRRSGHRILLDRDITAKHLKRWQVGSHLRTEILCRALPWSRLILENQGMINDMNLKTTDRLSAVLVGLTILLLPFVLWQPWLALVVLACVGATVFLNRDILVFYVRKRGLPFAAMTVPWQMLYFFYSGVVFVLCWVWYTSRHILGLRKAQEVNDLQ
ncbi:MAG: glycosyltransferase family 2 protein [Pyrinomonadaceae bacterium]